MSVGVLIATCAGAIAGGMLAAVGAVIAARRNEAQPIESSVAEEMRFLELLEQDLGQWVRVHTEVRDADFSNLERIARFSSIRERGVAAMDAGLAQRAARAAEFDDEEAMAACVAELRVRCGGVEEVDVAELLRVGSGVVSASAGREQNTERSPIERTENDATPFRRKRRAASRARVLSASAFGVVAGIVSVSVAGAAFEGSAAVIAGMCLLMVVFGGTIVACVDLDTFYLDVPTFVWWAIATWAGVLGAAAVAGTLRSVLPGVAGAVGVAVGFEVIARGWGRLRGITQGAGDTWIALVTAGVPAAVCSDWRVAVWSVLAGAGGVVVQWSVLAVQGRASATTPVPFGPHLVGGGFVALCAWMVIG